MNIAFRVDASIQIGTGHFLRCLALADALKKRGAQISFVCRHLPEHLKIQLAAKGYQLMPLDSSSNESISDNLAHAHWLGTSQYADAQASIQVLSERSWDWLVVDHYALDARWESVLRQKVSNIFVIDDIADRMHDCDVLLDQNFYFDNESRYTGLVPGHCQMLLGPRYALLREDFLQMRKQAKPRSGPIKNILVFFGGVDADNHTEKIIRALSGFIDYLLNVVVVIGAQHPARKVIESICAGYGFECHVQTTNMPALMSNADLAIGAGGIATWERCCLGLPALVVSLAENQKKQIFDSARAGLLYSPEFKCDFASGILRHMQSLIENPGLLEFISRNGMDAVDGRGSLRAMRKMGCVAVKIRLASESDSKNIMAWRNHPSIRGVSDHKEPIALVDHEHWMSKLLRDKQRILLIGYIDEEHPVGVVRFDMAENTAKVSIYLVPGMVHQGLGLDLMDSAEQWLHDKHPSILLIQAKVLGGNLPSHRLFAAGGYNQDFIFYSKKL